VSLISEFRFAALSLLKQSEIRVSGRFMPLFERFCPWKFTVGLPGSSRLSFAVALQRILLCPAKYLIVRNAIEIRKAVIEEALHFELLVNPVVANPALRVAY